MDITVVIKALRQKQAYFTGYIELKKDICSIELKSF